MATLQEAQEITKKFTKEFFNLKGVQGTGTMICDCCDKPYIHVSLNKNTDKSVLDKIPNKYEGLKVMKVFAPVTVIQTSKTDVLEPSQSEKDKFQKEFEGKEKYVIDITKKGRYVINNSPIVGGYIPEDIGILLDVQNKPKTIADLKNGVRKYEHLEGLLIYLHTKGLISINGITSPKAEDFSNARGGRRGGGRRAGGRPAVRRVVARRRAAVRRSTRPFRRGRTGGVYGRRYGWGWGVYPFAVLPAYAYYYNVGSPNRIKITPKGLKYLQLNPETNIYTYFLSAVASGLIYDERNLYNTLKLGEDYNDVAGWLYGNKLITFA